MAKIFVGIDPGAKGGMGIIRRDYPSDDYMSYGKEDWLEVANDLKTTQHEVIIAIERPDWHAAEGKKISMNALFQSGANFGFWKGFFHPIELIEVAPREWQKMLRGVPGGDTKEKAKNWLQGYYKEPPPGIYGPKGGYLDGPGDALCIANWLKMKTDLEEKIK